MRSEPVVYNPRGGEVELLPRIYAFANGSFGDDIVAVALASDGTVLSSHCCSSESFIARDLGVVFGGMGQVRHGRSYRQHYPNGYVMEFVPLADAEEHAGLRAAIEANKMRDAKDEPTESGATP